MSSLAGSNPLDPGLSFNPAMSSSIIQYFSRFIIKGTVSREFKLFFGVSKTKSVPVLFLIGADAFNIYFLLSLFYISVTSLILPLANCFRIFTDFPTLQYLAVVLTTVLKSHGS